MQKNILVGQLQWIGMQQNMLMGQRCYRHVRGTKLECTGMQQSRAAQFAQWSLGDSIFNQCEGLQRPYSPLSSQTSSVKN